LADRLRHSLSIIHTSDVHLETDSFGTGPSGDALRDRVRRAFSGVIDIANARRADLLLIVGDLFDSSRVSEAAMEFAMGEMARAAMPVVMIPGNHDAHDERSLYANLDGAAVPRNLRLILDPEGSLIDFPEIEARIWGRALVEHTPEYRPLAGIPKPEPGRWNIAMAHGLFTEDSDGFRSSPITPAEIEASAYDYIALGHIHVFGDVSQGATRAAYCGTPAPLYVSDNTGWVAWIECVPGEPVRIERVAVNR
jgi:exonuclease SbcD